MYGSVIIRVIYDSIIISEMQLCDVTIIRLTELHV
jgi:hypothetical protein